MLSQYIHPLLRFVTRFSKCKCPNAEEQLNFAEEKWALLNINFPRLGIQSALDGFVNEQIMADCPTCKQLRQETTERSLVEAPQVLAISISRLDIDTRQQIKDLVATPDIINLPLAADSVVEPSTRKVSYKLSAAILPTPGHFLALIQHGGRCYKVSDAHQPELAGRLDIRRAEIYLFTKVDNEANYM